MQATKTLATGARFQTAIGIAAAAMLALLWLTPAQAQESVQRGRVIWGQKAGCIFCHGWSGDGHGDEHADGAAANIRETILTRDQIHEVIKCGRPGSAMPHFDKFAYTDKRCYDATEADLGKDTPPSPPTPLQIFEVDAVADYVAAKIKGAGPVTADECREYFGGAGAICEKYPARK